MFMLHTAKKLCFAEPAKITADKLMCTMMKWQRWHTAQLHGSQQWNQHCIYQV